jgi:hypothetical protein
MAPAESKLHIAALGQDAISGIAVDLKYALEARKMGDWPLGLTVGRVKIDHPRRIAATPWSVVPRIGPKLPGLRSTSARIEHRRRRLVGEQLCRTLEHAQKPFMDGPQQEGRPADPIGQRRTIEIDPLTA